MTADLDATATGLIERSAAAYVSGVPEDAADDGLFGPASVAWRVSTDLAAPVAGLRSLLMQALHPLAMAGVDQHSGWRRDPVGRLAATSAYLATVTFGERAVAVQAAARVRRIHDHVRGTDAVTGRRYAAGDPALLLWVHAALVQSSLAAVWAFGTPLSAQDSDRYVEEMMVAAELVGVPPPQVPASVAGSNGTSRRSGRRCAACRRPHIGIACCRRPDRLVRPPVRRGCARAGAGPVEAPPSSSAASSLGQCAGTLRSRAARGGGWLRPRRRRRIRRRPRLRHHRLRHLRHSHPARPAALPRFHRPVRRR